MLLLNIIVLRIRIFYRTRKPADRNALRIITVSPIAIAATFYFPYLPMDKVNYCWVLEALK